MVKLESQYDTLRTQFGEEEGHDVANAFCKANYGVGDGHDAESELAIAFMELTFRPLSLSGLDVQSCYMRQRESVSHHDLILCKINHVNSFIRTRCVRFAPQLFASLYPSYFASYI